MKFSYVSMAVRLVVLISETIVVAKEWVVMVRAIAQLVREDRVAREAGDT